MLPVILETKHLEKADQWIQDWVKKHKVSDYYVFVIRPEKVELSIEQIRDLKRALITSANSKRLFVLHSFDNATLEAQNALLKTLEEKTAENMFVMVAENAERILPTIRSRSKIIPLDPKNQMVEMREESQQLFEALTQGSSYAFLGSKSLLSVNREEALKILDELILFLRNKIKTIDPSQVVSLKKTLELKNLLLNNNLNPQLAVDQAFIFFKKKYQTNKS